MVVRSIGVVSGCVLLSCETPQSTGRQHEKFSEFVVVVGSALFGATARQGSSDLMHQRMDRIGNDLASRMRSGRGAWSIDRSAAGSSKAASTIAYGPLTQAQSSMHAPSSSYQWILACKRLIGRTKSTHNSPHRRSRHHAPTGPGPAAGPAASAAAAAAQCGWAAAGLAAATAAVSAAAADEGLPAP